MYLSAYIQMCEFILFLQANLSHIRTRRYSKNGQNPGTKRMLRTWKSTTMHCSLPLPANC